jgi:hypothetical protein
VLQGRAVGDALSTAMTVGTLTRQQIGSKLVGRSQFSVLS